MYFKRVSSGWMELTRVRPSRQIRILIRRSRKKRIRIRPSIDNPNPRKTPDPDPILEEEHLDPHAV